MTFVVDADVTLSWSFREDWSAATQALLDRAVSEDLVVPGVWVYEICNRLGRAVRTGEVGIEHAERTIAALRDLTIEVARSSPMGLIERMVETGLTAYDAAYLELAAAREVPLATLDRRLRAAAKAAGVELLPAAEDR